MIRFIHEKSNQNPSGVTDWPRNPEELRDSPNTIPGLIDFLNLKNVTHISLFFGNGEKVDGKKFVAQIDLPVTPVQVTKYFIG